MLVHLDTIRDISSSPTVSRRSVRCCSASFASSCSSSFTSFGNTPYFSSAARLRSYSACAFSIEALVCSICSLIFCALPIAFFSFSHLALMAENSSLSSLSSASISERCESESLSVSFESAADSISSCIIFLDISSISVGIEFISVFIKAQASSTKSIALSGKNLSEIYLFDSTAALISAESCIFTP